mmetsp:Transcript_36869/g.92418  ORF Transcript_36869/g.92418 Transcript_36869/m.92418 type:complete len:343 (+) Transcript_36869:147-1175(+)
MPELPELRGYASFINENCAGVVFARVSLSSAARHPPIELPWHRFLISAESRGKELMLRFRESSSSSTASDDRLVQYSFLMGMSGRWDFVPSSLLVDEETKLANKLKHAHVLFESADQLYTLCFVDTRRFGRWTPSPEGWSAERGPDPTTEYDAFEANVLSGLESCSRSFQRPVCELLLDQRYFNGVGNYLRAEILYRAGVTDPFRSAHQVLLECPQILPLCRDVCNEVIERNLLNDHEAFTDWLQCYGKALKRKDSSGRTVWYSNQSSKSVVVKTEQSTNPERKKSTPKKRKGASSSSTSSASVMPRDYGTRRIAHIKRETEPEVIAKKRVRRTRSLYNAVG